MTPTDDSGGEPVTVWDIDDMSWADLNASMTYVALYTTAKERRFRRFLRRVPLVRRALKPPVTTPIPLTNASTNTDGNGTITFSWDDSGSAYARASVSPATITGTGAVRSEARLAEWQAKDAGLAEEISEIREQAKIEDEILVSHLTDMFWSWYSYAMERNWKPASREQVNILAERRAEVLNIDFTRPKPRTALAHRPKGP